MREEHPATPPTGAGDDAAPATTAPRARGPRCSTWLRGPSGGFYRLDAARRLGAVGFHIAYQDGEGRLWRLLRDALGTPLHVSLAVTRGTVVAQVPGRRGAVQLIPVDAGGVARGAAPEMVHLVDDRAPRSAAMPAPVTVAIRSRG